MRDYITFSFFPYNFIDLNIIITIILIYGNIDSDVKL